MMLYLLVSAYEFKQFLQIVLWIAVPGTIVAVGMTVYLHYRRRKRLAELHEDDPMDTTQWKLALAGSSEPSTSSSDPLPDWLASSDPDNTSLLKKYEAEVRRYKEDYSLLKEDFKELEYKYEDLRNKAYNGQKTSYEEKPLSIQEKEALQQQLKDAEHSLVNARAEIEKLQSCFSQQIEELGSQHRKEKEELVADMATLRAQHEALQEKFGALQSQQAAPAAAFEVTEGKTSSENQFRLADLEQRLAKAEEENSKLKNKINEGEYLQDLAQEKKLQVDFLQQQLEQRIRNFHQLERKADEAAVQLREMKDTADKFEYRIQVLSEELNDKQQEVARIQEEATEWRATAQISQQEHSVQQQHLEEKTLHINQLESSLRQMEEEHENLSNTISSRQSAMDSLRDELLREQSKAKELEHKLELSSQLLVRIYSELARSLNAGIMQWQQEQEPVAIEAQPAT